MYNRYIPQNDGCYTRTRIPEQRREPSPPVRKDPPTTNPAPTPPCQTCACQPVPAPRPCRQNPPQKVSSFWKQLLPKNFATEDLLIVLLLLLMAGACPEDQNSALLTLALYLFL